ncbi:MupG family TIM beta-alpha barrel fold protein [Companilactobacillus sp. HBUAS59544]|jgi:hypothetical protein|uniref:MupG family TIM beta-alpha barrel fold protein n=1 Tax=Companilactobacillus sp. HBUAS59544 TaxID=3109363 RepID=UPI002FF1B542
MFGFSIYLDSSVSNKKEYINKMIEGGFKGVFTSLQIPEENSENYLKNIRELGNVCKQNNLNLTVDISDTTLSKLNISLLDNSFFEEIGITTVRIDAGISNETIALASQHLKIALNASTISEKDLKELENENANFNNLEAWNNYYPHPNTGIGKNFLLKKMKMFHNHNVKFFAFIPGDNNLRQPLFCGLPTLEEQRYAAPFYNLLELISMGVDSIYIGDEGLSKNSEYQIKQYLQNNIMVFYLNQYDANYEKWIFKKHRNRADCPEDVFRSAESRLWDIPDLPPENCSERIKGSVTIDNLLYGRYAGEIQIVKKNLPSDKKVNVIAHICNRDIPLLNFANENQKIIFKSIKESEY